MIFDPETRTIFGHYRHGLSVLRDCAPRNLDALIGEDGGELTVTQRLSGNSQPQ